MATTSSDVSIAAPPAELPKVLGVTDGVAIALSNISPTLSIGIGVGAIGATIACPGLPILFILAFLPIVGIALAYAKLNRRDPNCGAAYVWAGKALGPAWGYLIGWVIIASNLLFLAYMIPLTGDYGLTSLSTLGVHSVAGLRTADPHTVVATVIGLVLLTGLTLLAVRGVELAARVQKVLVVCEAGTVAFFCCWALVAGHKTAFSWSWFSPTVFPSAKTLATGIVLSVFIYWGWEAAFAVTEENSDRRTSSRSGFTAVFIVLGLFVLAAVAFQKATTPAELAANGASALPYIGGELGGSTGAAVTTTILFLCIVSCVQSVVIAMARQTLAMGRDGVLGPLWARLHPAHGTPAAGTIAITVLAAAIALVSLRLGSVETIVVGTVTAVGILVALYYALTGVACAAVFARTAGRDAREWLTGVVVPLISGLVLAALGVYLGYQQWTSTNTLAFNAANGRFLTIMPLAVLALGIPFGLWTKYGRKAPYFAGEIN
jgi:amino acid transporter